MSATSSEQAKRLQQIIETIEDRKLAVERATSNLNRQKIAVEAALKDAQETLDKAKVALSQSRQQFQVELRKFDPSILTEDTVAQ